jgi:DNA-binding NarL/FixJ family response regulator
MALHVVVAACPLVQQSIRESLEAADCAVVGQAYGGDEAVLLARTKRPDILILHDQTPSLNGVETARAIARRHPGLPMILLTTMVSEYHISTAFSAGVRGYVVAADAGDDLVRAVYEVARGATFVSPRASRALCERYCR